MLQLLNMSGRTFNAIVKIYPSFSISSYDSRDRPHAVSLGNEAKAGDHRSFGEGGNLCRRQLFHLTLGKVTSKITTMVCELGPHNCINDLQMCVV